MQVFIIDAYAKDGRYLCVAIDHYFTSRERAQAWIDANRSAVLDYRVREFYPG